MKLELSYLVLLSSINNSVKLAVCQRTSMSVPHKHCLVLPGNFYCCSHKQTQSIAVSFFLTRDASLKKKMYPEQHPPNKQEEHLFASCIVKLLP